MSVLRLEHVTKRFGGLVAVNDLSFEVKERQIHALIGPNGLRYKLKKLSSTSLR